MKVAYNGCFGGFGLSPLALTEYAKLKGLTLTWYWQDNTKKKYIRISVENIKDSCWTRPYTEDLGESIDKISNDKYYSPNFYDENRSDPDLITVIETLGKKANGTFAELQIQEIPDWSQFEITEYDGYESVEPPRMSW